MKKLMALSMLSFSLSGFAGLSQIKNPVKELTTFKTLDDNSGGGLAPQQDYENFFGYLYAAENTSTKSILIDFPYILLQNTVDRSQHQIFPFDLNDKNITNEICGGTALGTLNAREYTGTVVSKNATTGEFELKDVTKYKLPFGLSCLAIQ